MEWYVNPETTGAYYNSSNPNIAHWNNAAQRHQWRDETLKYSSYFDVRRDSSGRLNAVRERL
jgi:hypothetical protein